MNNILIENSYREIYKTEILELLEDIYEEENLNEFYRLMDESVNETNKKFMKNKRTEGLPHLEMILWNTEEMAKYVLETIRENWNAEHADDIVPTERYAADFNSFIKGTNSIETIEAYFANKRHLNIFKFNEFFLNNNFVVFSKDDRLLSFWIVKISDKYVGQAVFGHTEKMDLALLVKKIKSVLLHIEVDSETAKLLLNICSDILMPVITMNKSNHLKKIYKDMDELLQIIELKPQLKKVAHLSRLQNAYIYPDKILDYNQVIFEVEIMQENKRIYTTQYNYSIAEKAARDLLVNDKLGKYEDKLDKVERTFIYYVLFKIMHYQRNFQATIHFGEYLLEGKKLEEYEKEIRKSFPQVLPISSFDYDSLIKRYHTNYKLEIGKIILNAYLKEGMYEKAFNFLKTNGNVTNGWVYAYLNNTENKNLESNVKLSSERELILHMLESGMNDDISLILYDSIQALTGYPSEKVMVDWKKKCEDADFRDGFIIPVSKHIRNIIITVFWGREYELTAKLIDIYCKYFFEDESSFLELKKFILRFSQEDKFLIHKEILKSLQRGEYLLEQTNRRELEGSISSLIVQVKSTYLNAGTLINQALIDEKKRVLFNAIEENLKVDSEQLEKIYSEMSNQFDKILDSKTISKDKLKYYEQKMQQDKYFGDSWAKLLKLTKKNILNGLVIYDELNSIDIDESNVDYSPVILCWCRALETEILHKIYEPYKAYCKEYNLRPYCFYDPQSRVKEHFTLGAFWILTGGIPKTEELTKEVHTLLKQQNKEIFLQFAKDKAFIHEDDTELASYIYELQKSVNKINVNYRNKSAHPDDLNKVVAEKCFDMLFPTQEILIKLVKNYKTE